MVFAPIADVRSVSIPDRDSGEFQELHVYIDSSGSLVSIPDRDSGEFQVTSRCPHLLTVWFQSLIGIQGNSKCSLSEPILYLVFKVRSRQPHITIAFQPSPLTRPLKQIRLKSSLHKLFSPCDNLLNSKRGRKPLLDKGYSLNFGLV